MPLTIAVTGQALIHQPLQLSAEASLLAHFLSSDATLANFEGVVEAYCAWPTKTKTVHAVKRDVVRSLAELGFRAMAHANNHAFDLGPPGIIASRTAFDVHGMALTGSGNDLNEALKPAYISTPQRRISLYSVDLGPQPDIVYAAPTRPGIAPLRLRRRIRLPESEYQMMTSIQQALGDDRRLAARRAVGYSPAQTEGFDAFGTTFLPGDRVAADWQVDPEDWQQLASRLQASRDRNELIVVAIHNHHWDADWATTPAWLDALTDQLVEYGADLVIGTGAPVMQPMRFHRGRPILSGLGNFIFHTARSDTYDREGVDVWRSVAVRLTFSDEGLLEHVNVMPIAVGRPSNGEEADQPMPLEGQDADEIYTRYTSRLLADEEQLVSRFQPEKAG
ncbi:CapA family protein [Rhizobium oryzicola]|uniref:CapA family protein n=1 Tax=Rhizobium oryzicola TaxID=1232668 RepID=A0ABT8SYG1_9HYPH|nr:CapA family protein [Rhizobium oryzicola]MDO1583011.1 CapA family protein [Rhizobium oryzicola]